MVVRAKRLLIFTGELGQFNYYREVALRLGRLGWRIGVCCDRDDVGVAETMQAECSRSGYDFFLHRGDREAGALGFLQRHAVRTRLHRFRRWCASRKLEPGADDLRLLELFLIYHVYRLSSVRDILRRFKPWAITVGEDGIANNYWAIAVARRLAIPSAVLPYGMPDSATLVVKGIEEQARAGDLKRTSGVFGAYIREACPSWIKSTRHGEVLYLPQPFIVAVELLGIAPRLPWNFQGGQADRLLLEGPDMGRRYAAEGISSQKFVTTGSIYTDVMADVVNADARLREAHARCQKIEAGRLRVLVAIPPSDHGLWNAGAEISSLADYAVAIRSHFAGRRSVEIGWTLHPRMLEKDRQGLAQVGVEDDGRFAVSRIPEHDVFVHSRSSMARWAFVSHKPVIDFDLYGFGSNDYPDCSGYFFVRELRSLLDVLDQLHGDDEAYGKAARASAVTGEGFGELDGAAAHRIDQALLALSSGRRLH